ncbi:hypothetical protein PS2_006956 [Malus domestica]
MEVVISSPLAEHLHYNKCGVESLETQYRCGNHSDEWMAILVCFREGGDLQWLQGSPWYFDKSLVLLAEIKGVEVPSNVPLCEQEFWIQVPNIPPSLMILLMGEEIDWAIGRLVATLNIQLLPIEGLSAYYYLYGLLDHCGADYD